MSRHISGKEFAARFPDLVIKDPDPLSPYLDLCEATRIYIADPDPTPVVPDASSPWRLLIRKLFSRKEETFTFPVLNSQEPKST